MREQLVKSTAQTNGGVNSCLGVTVHETGNASKGANAAAHANLQSSGNSRSASWHITVDDKEAVRSYPDTAQCWHAGNREANNTRIAVEICVNEDGDYNKAFHLAAETVRELRAKHKLGRSDVIQHYEHSGKNCPAKLRAAGRWKEFLDLTEPNQTIGEVVTVGMINPVVGRVSSEYSPNRKHPVTGRLLPHLGIDIAAPTGTKVVAVFAGEVDAVRTGSYNGDQRSGALAGRTGNGVVITNPDGESQYYGHLSKVSVRKGDKVTAGQKIGEVGATGVVTGPHLHLEMHDANGNTRNPRVDFKHFGVTPGEGGAVDVKPVGSVKPAPKPKPSSKAKVWPHKNLLVDGSFGKVSVTALQVMLAGIKKYSGRIDGDFGPMTRKALQSWLHGLGYYKGRIDGDFGDMSVKALQRFLVAKGELPSLAYVDGDLGKTTWKALQRYINSQAKHFR